MVPFTSRNTLGTLNQPSASNSPTLSLHLAKTSMTLLTTTLNPFRTSPRITKNLKRKSKNQSQSSPNYHPARKSKRTLLKTTHLKTISPISPKTTILIKILFNLL